MWQSTGEKMSKSVKYHLVRLQRNKLSLEPLWSLFIHRDRYLETLMKWMFSLLILMAGSVAFAGEAGLQQPVPTSPETTAVGRSASDVVNVLAKHLSLTEDQESKILPIIIERQRKIQEVWTSSTLFVRQKQGQVRGINEDSDRRINALLTGDQQKAYTALEQKWKVQRRLRRVQNESSS
jgi:protein CpxP